MGRIELPYPAQTASLPGNTAKASKWPKVLLAVLVLLATATHLGPRLAGVAESTTDALDLDFTGDLFDPVVYDEAYLKEHTKCPVQPRPLPPKIAWNLTEEERVESLKKFSAAVVGPP